MTERSLPSGHNGGPPLDGPDARQDGRCKNCIHWHAPPEREQRDYENFRLGLSRRRVKRPSGTCDRVLLVGRTSTVFSATTADFCCRNFEAKPPMPRPSGGGFVTIWKNGRIVWQGPEEKIPPRFQQQDLDLDDPDETSGQGGGHDRP
ncbi:hypothetical protein G3A56_20400 [Rhizobium oryzihabitans]|uniref:Uncharacterized protein n=2 Tax=Rhizobium TaxID=379 RepID=A0A285V1R7_9HYPH|nr:MULTISPECIES: hypothetical protein [Hyphomicrobiales]HAU77112.1 hypothetical protein [Agrobacterium sp.]MCQ9147424.1 hypothetical protein [Ochrobactrum sp. BTU2]MDH1271745.1 hypothetical protein [Agrobacterium pusense]QIB40257.1 hypothetical protein G3A56_20400 [Rhizobium oryzihabitans]RRY17991.1 hypothetical protein EGJ57_16765 [Brucella anthropi]